MANFKPISMPGTQRMLYKGFVIEWIEHRQDYRIYRPEKEQNTVAYEDTLQDAIAGIDENEWRFR